MFRFVAITLLYITSVVAGAATENAAHFLADKTYREIVHADFLKREPLIKKALGAGYAQFSQLDVAKREAMEFLYAYMPLNDVADYSFHFFRQQMEYAMKAREEMAWGRAIPDDVFRHFVLPYRVNNENLDSARMVLYPVLKERLKGLSMYDAALEVNHWCHEWVTYRPADIRTSAPLATMRTGLGRCGEESTFTVTALRAAGIPARQCYTPRWAHCDDNHAWVEVWIDGEWMFLGACEPDPELNMGWFSIPSTRCMMVHTKAFGRYHGSEEVMVETPRYSELNLLSHYAKTRTMSVKVVDQNNAPVSGAKVKFKLYNYSEYYTLATSITDERGIASATSGYGDLLIWATDGVRYNFAKADLRVDSAMVIQLSRKPGDIYTAELDIFPPQPTKAKVFPEKQKVVVNAHRLAYEDSVRNARMSRFVCNTPRSQWSVRPNANLTEEQIKEIVNKSEGNHEQIIAFINNHTEAVEGLYLYDYLRSYSDKDLRDITADMLEHHLTIYDGALPLDVYKKGIMPARISNEGIVMWRNIKPYQAPTLNKQDNYYNCPISPLGVDKLGTADAHSRNIYYVAACRANGTPAYLDNATNIVYRWEASASTLSSANSSLNGEGQQKWAVVALDTMYAEGENNGEGLLTLTYSDTEPKVPQYYPHFTLQKFENGDFVSFDFEEDARLGHFPATLQLPAGYYCLSTGNRYPNGDVLSRMEFFNLAEGESVAKEITLRPLKADRAQALPSISPEIKVTADSIALANYAGVKGMLFINLGDYREPSKHLVNEMLQLREDFNHWGGNMYIISPTDALSAIAPFKSADVIAYTDNATYPLQAALAQALQMEAEPRYPFVAFVTNTGQILYHSEGYSIGSAEQILKVAKKF